MTDLRYKVEFFSPWHCGSGLSAGADVDALVIKDEKGLPFIPGRTVKGLVRQALEELLHYISTDSSSTKNVDDILSAAFFSNAEIPEGEYIEPVLRDGLFLSLSNTKIDSETGTAKDGSLRKTEAVVPCILEGIVKGIEECDKPIVVKAFAIIKELGLHRNRGLGRCRFSEISSSVPVVKGTKTADYQAISLTDNVKLVQLRCELLSAVVLNEKSKSTGPNASLDFIPGNAFLGVAARGYGEYSLEDALTVFHSGKVRFGDAHPACGGNRTLRASAATYHPKYGEKDNIHFNLHSIDQAQQNNILAIEKDGGQPVRVQRKQDRYDFWDFASIDNCSGQLTPAVKVQNVKVDKSFALKSAYDREHRRSKDEAMFGYEALHKGQVFFFTVEFDDSVRQDLKEKVIQSLVGTRHIGRSKSAEYGLVDISLSTFGEVESSCEPFKAGYYTVYADGRLIFSDEAGLPVLNPSAQDFGFNEEAEIDWTKTQLRFFSYAPYNGKRRCFDADRSGIEKGSVFVVKADSSPSYSAYVGEYNNEGFGRVIYNPSFLRIREFEEVKPSDMAKDDVQENVDNELIRYLIAKKEEKDIDTRISQLIDKWASSNKSRFRGESFASQWGRIRAIAMENRGKSANELEKEVVKYLTHGVAKEKWEGQKLDKLKAFFGDLNTKSNKNGDRVIEIPSSHAWIALLQLSSRMAKECRNSNTKSKS